MSPFLPGLVHTPATPFTPGRETDFDLYAKLIEFHLRHGAECLALPMHAGESVSLSDEEQRAMFGLAVRQVKGRVPVIAHVERFGHGHRRGPRALRRGVGRRRRRRDHALLLTPPPAMG